MSTTPRPVRRIAGLAFLALASVIAVVGLAAAPANAAGPDMTSKVQLTCTPTPVVDGSPVHCVLIGTDAAGNELFGDKGGAILNPDGTFNNSVVCSAHAVVPCDFTFTPSEPGNYAIDYAFGPEDPRYSSSRLTGYLVVGDHRTAQTITFTLPTNTVFGADVPLSASSTSGLPVTLVSSTPSVCTVVAGKAHVIALGTCTITASRDGDATYQPAASVTKSLTVTKAPIKVVTKASSGLKSVLTFKVSFTSTVTNAVTGAPVAGETVVVKVNGSKTGCTAVTNASGVATCTSPPISIALNVPFTATVAATPNYLAGSGTGTVKP